MAGYKYDYVSNAEIQELLEAALWEPVRPAHVVPIMTASPHVTGYAWPEDLLVIPDWQDDEIREVPYYLSQCPSFGGPV